MKKIVLSFISFFLLCSGLIPPLANASPDDAQNNLLNDLLIVDYWNKKINDRLPVTFNHLLQGGYFSMPSARMGEEGEVGAGYAYIPPYRNYNLRIQLTDRIEVSGNYRVFHGIKDPVLSPLGFGDYSDKGANLKLAIFHAEDTDCKWPGFSIGVDDVMGTRSFNAYYMVMTQVLLQQNLEISLGYGWNRIRNWFGGFNWMPLRNSGNPYLQGISLTAEYDAIHYKSWKREPHPKGRKTKSPINFGLKYRLWDNYDLSVSYRGDALAFSASTFYNFGTTKGFFAKYNDPLPYRSPVIVEPLGPLRTEEAMVEDLKCAFREQGFDLLQVWISYDPCGNKLLRIKVYNNAYRTEIEVRNRLNNLLAYVIPDNIDRVIVVMESTGFPIQEYYFTMEYVRQFSEKGMGSYELEVLTPLREVTFPDKCTETLLFDRPQELWNLEIFPLTRCYFGSSKGKFKYSIGLQLGLDGFLPKDVYYAVLLGCPILSDIDKVGDKDRLNPSQLINVRTDMTRYYKYKGVSVNEMYLQKTWNLGGGGWYARCATGYFEEMYGGVAGEFLYYPIDKPWAIGFEGAVVKKRKVGSLFFTNKIRKLHGFIPTYHKFLGSQYFLDLYYDWRFAKLEFKTMIGKFLANDYGARYEISRYFSSGLRITFWYTTTNGNDRVNGHRYYDKGVLFSMPLDIFYTHSDRFRWHYGISAWLRDVGATAETGQKLYWLINNQREH